MATGASDDNLESGGYAKVRHPARSPPFDLIKRRSGVTCRGMIDQESESELRSPERLRWPSPSSMLWQSSPTSLAEPASLSLDPFLKGRIPRAFTEPLSQVDASLVQSGCDQFPLSETVDRVEGHHERVTLTRNGRPAAVLISPEDLEALEDTLEILADPEARAEIDQAHRDIASGKGIRADELRARYLNSA